MGRAAPLLCPRLRRLPSPRSDAERQPAPALQQLSLTEARTAERPGNLSIRLFIFLFDPRLAGAASRIPPCSWMAIPTGHASEAPAPEELSNKNKGQNRKSREPQPCVSLTPPPCTVSFCAGTPRYRITARHAKPDAALPHLYVLPCLPPPFPPAAVGAAARQKASAAAKCRRAQLSLAALPHFNQQLFSPFHSQASPRSAVPGPVFLAQNKRM